MRVCVYVQLKIKVSDESAILQSIHFLSLSLPCSLCSLVFDLSDSYSNFVSILPLKIKAIKKGNAIRYRVSISRVLTIDCVRSIDPLSYSYSSRFDIDFRPHRRTVEFPQTRTMHVCVCVFVREKRRIMRSQKFEYIFRREKQK